MKFGLHIPNICPDDFDSGVLKEICVQADRLGFDSLWTGDHLLPPEPFGLVKIHEAVTVLSFIAGCTKSIRLGTSVILPLRHPILLANMLSTLDNLSCGRLDVGFGVGWYKKEFDANDVLFEKRGLIEEETIDILKKLWVENSVSYEGEFFRFADVTIRPKCVQKPHPPIVLGGYSEQTFRRIAKQADGWISWCTSAGEFDGGIRSIKRNLVILNRGESEMDYIIDILTCISKDRDSAEKKAKELGFDNLKSVVGGVADCAGRVKEYIDAGADHIVFVLRPYGEEIESMSIVADELIPTIVKK